MEKLMNKFLKSSIITSIVLIVLGLLLIFESEATIISISYIIGAALVALGTASIIKFIKNVESEFKNELDIVYGVVTIILGILVITNPHAIASIIPFILGLGIIISSATKLQYSFELKKNNNDLWKTTMVISILSVICGIVLLFNPFKGAELFSKIIGIFITIYAILDIISTITIKKNVTEIKNALDGTIVEAEVVVEEQEEKEKESAKKTSKKEKKTSSKNKPTKKKKNKENDK